MACHVEVSTAALLDAQDAFTWMETRSAERASEWYDGLLAAIFSLDEMPGRCGLAPENNDADETIRQLLYTKRRVTYRIIFVILREDSDEDDGIVRVYRIRHGAQRPLTAGETPQGEQD